MVGTAKPKDSQPRERVLSDAELAAIWKACGDDDHGRCIKLLILTGCRRQEIGGMCWSEIDFEQGTWTLPAAGAKTAARIRCRCCRPCSPSSRRCRAWRAAISCSASAPAASPAWSRGKAALDARSGVKNWTTHDIRRSVATAHGRSRRHAAHHRANLEPSIRPQARTGGHLQSQLDYEREVRAALAMWHDHLRTLVAGGKRKIIPSAARCLLKPSAACGNKRVTAL